MKRRIGKREVSALGMGCWAIGGPFQTQDGRFFGYGNVKDEESIATIHKAIEMGISFFDTADVYGAGHSERILGQGLREFRDDVFIATKFGSMFEEWNRIIPDKHTSSIDYLRSAVLDSCRKLGTDFIDLYQYHWWECPMDEAEIVRNALDDLVSEGTIGGYGWSTDNVERAALFAEGKHCTAIQYVLNLVTDNPSMRKLCHERGLASIIRGPLSYGILTGKYSDSYSLPKNHWVNALNWKEGRFAKVRRLVDEIREVLIEDGRTLVQAALGYIWAIEPTAIPIPGAKNIAQITENAQAMEYGPLNKATVSRVDEMARERL
ncbi:MAG: aldo/keto reductase [Candidatus Thorarchaeota archaeon]